MFLKNISVQYCLSQCCQQTGCQFKVTFWNKTKSKSKYFASTNVYLTRFVFKSFKLEISEIINIMVESIEKRFDSFQSELRKYALESGHALVEELTEKMKLWQWKLFHWTRGWRYLYIGPTSPDFASVHVTYSKHWDPEQASQWNYR